MANLLLNTVFSQSFTPTYFGIRTNDDTIWLAGGDMLTRYSHLKGRVLLCLSQPTRVTDIKLHFTGRHHIKPPRWDESFTFLNFHKQTWSFIPKARSQILSAGNYEFPFEICLPTNMPDTVEGDDIFTRYKLQARIYGTGVEKAETTKDIKVCRAYPSLFITEPKTMTNTWPQKIIYKVEIPNETYTFGSEIRTAFRFIPLLKGLQIESMTVRLTETQERPGGVPTNRSRTVAVEEYQSGDIELHDDVEWYEISKEIRVPASTQGCLQSTRTTLVHVSHSVDCHVRLLNPDGHTSSIDVSLPIFIRFCPLGGLGAIVSREYMEILKEVSDDPLPLYDDHIFDRKHEAGPGRVESQSTDEDDRPPEYISFEDMSQVPDYSVATL